MKQVRIFAALFLFAALVGVQLFSVAQAGAPKNGDVKFTVRIENVSNKDGQVAKDGSRWPFALSPGLWVLHRKEVVLFTEGKKAILGLEAQAEDGNPTEIVNYLMGHHSDMQHGVFNTPMGANAPAPILPGGAYEFSFTAKLGMHLSVVTMFGQSNDWFYAAKNSGIDLFENGKPISGDLTAKFMLYDAGTEVDEEPGVGANQAPRQQAHNTGEAENGVVHKAKSSTFFGKNGELFRITITPEPVM